MDVQVTIPKTSKINDSYTVYSVHVELPLRSYFLEKRYSDFATLVTNMETELGSMKFPKSIPAKNTRIQLFGSILDVMKMVEARRISFENILVDVLNDVNLKMWKNTKSFTEFLELPDGIFSGTDGFTVNEFMANFGTTFFNVDGHFTSLQQWLIVYQDCERLLQECKKLLSDNILRVKRLLTLVQNKIYVLTQGVNEFEEKCMSKKRRLDDMELDISDVGNLKNHLRNLQSECNTISNLCHNSNFSTPSMPGGWNGASIPKMSSTNGNGSESTSRSSRSLFGNSRRVLGQPLPETEVTRGLNNVELMQSQQQIMADQESEVAQLSQVIQRQRQMATEMNNELSSQMEIIDDIDNQVNKTHTKLGYANKKARILNNV